MFKKNSALLRRWQLLLGLALSLVVATLLFWPRTKHQARQTLTLSDGSILEFKGITYGTNHSFCLGSRWDKTVAFLSKRGALSNLLHRCGARVPLQLSYRTSYQCMASWFYWRAAADVPGGLKRLLYDPLHYVILDDAGHASNVRMADPRWSDASRSQLVMQCDTPYFPRRSAYFRLQILRRWGNDYAPVVSLVEA